MFTKKRYTSVFPLETICKKLGVKITFDYVFSGVYEEIAPQTLILTEINPYRTLKILQPGRELYIYINYKEKNYIAKGVVKKIEDHRVILEFNKNNIDNDKRQFYRFHFCCEDLGEFVLLRNSTVITNEVCIYEISKTGVGLYIPAGVSLEVGDTYYLFNKESNIKLDIEVVHFKNIGKFNVVGNKILETNVNLLKYILQEYIKVSEKIVFKG